MGEELIYVTLISSIFSLIGLVTYFSLSTRKMRLESELNLKRFRVGKRYKLKEMELPQRIDNRSPTTKITDKAISGLINRYVGGRGGTEEEEEEINAEGIIGGVVDYLEAHPEQKKNINKIVDRLLGGGGEEKQQSKVEDLR